MLGASCSPCCSSQPPPPPPPFCDPADPCIFRVSITSPKAYGPYPVNQCRITNTLAHNRAQSPIDCDCIGTPYYETEFTEIVPVVGVRSPQAQYGTYSAGATFIAYVSIIARLIYVNCEWVAVMYYEAAAFGQCGGGSGEIRTIRQSDYTVPSVVARSTPAGEQCEPIFDRPNRLPVLPLTLTVNGESTSLGAWKDVNDSPTGSPSSEHQNCFDALLNDITATFLFEKRAACWETACNCSQSLNGLRATFMGKTFTLGTNYTYDPGGNQLQTWEHFTTGNITYVFRYNKTVQDANHNLMTAETVRIDLYCETDNTQAPSVDRWYALVERGCLYVEDGSLIDTVTKTIGVVVCGTTTGCGNLSANLKVPLGEIIDAETLPGYPATTKDLDPCPECAPCTIPNAPAFELSEICE